jgi:hypothetical protein
MDSVAKSYLEKMLEGCKMGMTQIDEALKSVEDNLEQINSQKEQMEDQREEILTTKVDLEKLLGVTDEESEED